jgi:hypothetical protein
MPWCLAATVAYHDALFELHPGQREGVPPPLVAPILPHLWLFSNTVFTALQWLHELPPCQACQCLQWWRRWIAPEPCRGTGPTSGWTQLPRAEASQAVHWSNLQCAMQEPVACGAASRTSPLSASQMLLHALQQGVAVFVGGNHFVTHA